MEPRLVHNYNHKQLLQIALIKLVKMPLLLIGVKFHIHKHLNARLIYQNAIGTEVQDAQVEDAQHILAYNQHALISQQQDNLVGLYQQLAQTLLA